MAHSDVANQAERPACLSSPATGESHSATSLRLAERAAQLSRRLAADLQPRGALEEIVVSVLARNAATMELGVTALASALGLAVQNAAALQLLGSTPTEESGLVSAMSNDLVRRASQFSLQQQRAFFSAVKVWTRLPVLKNEATNIALFDCEDGCVQYLAKWQERQPWVCSGCSGNTRWLLDGRAKLECACGAQHSIRQGTVFAGSRVPLFSWFELASALVVDPERKAAELAPRVRVVRLATVRTMIKKIRAALSSPTAEQELAGLPAYIERHLRQVYYPRVQTSLSPESEIGLFDDDKGLVMTGNVEHLRRPQRPR